jgi:hypothetical protein
LHRLRTILPFAGLSCAVLTCIVLSVVLTTGFDSGTKLRQFLLRLVLVTPALLWILRQRSQHDDGRHSDILIGPFFLIFGIIVIPISLYLRDGVYSADESAYRFQARIMRSLHAYAQAPPDAVLRQFAFKNEVRFQGRWFGKYPPGWPALLATLSWLLPDWLVSPALGLLLLWLVYKISRRIYPESVASIAVAFMACSPFFLFTCVGYLSHVACGVFVALATLSLLTSLETGRTRDFALTFAALGAASLIRPFTATCLGLVLASVLVWNLRNDRIQLYKVLALGVPMALVVISVLLYDNALLTGHFWKSPYALAGRSDLPPELQLSVSNIRRHAFIFTPVALARLELHSFPFVLALAVYAVIQEKSPRSLLLAMIPLSLVIGHMIFSGVSSDSFVGERYYFEAYFAVAILAAAGWEQLRQKWKPSQSAVRATILATASLTVYNYVYLTNAAIEYRQGYATIYETAERLPGEKLLIFMQPGNYFDPSHFNPNSPQWENSRVLFVLDPGDGKTRSLAASVLRRPVWIVMAYNPQTKRAIVKQQTEAAGAP